MLDQVTKAAELDLQEDRREASTASTSAVQQAFIHSLVDDRTVQ